MRTTVTLGVALALAGCGGKGSILDELTAGGNPGPSSDPSNGPSGDPSGGSSDTDGTPTTSATTGDNPTGGPSGTNPLDVLFVIDNSGSMAEEQALLARDIAALTNSERDLRIGITTTDAGNPRCPAAMTTPERGTMATQSCIQAVLAGEFTFNEEDYGFACDDVCNLAELAIAPTTTIQDPEPKPRPWFEQAGGVTNLADVGVTLTQALQCALPQGVAGCGFESPLESMYLALARAMDASSPEYGFLRPEADLVVVILTDEVDCSHNPEFAEIFTTNKVFWSDPESPASTSAVCFNAGVQCQGAGPTYAACPAVDKDISGAVTNDPDAAVLHPVSRYADFLAGIAAQKTGGARVRLLAIAGVPIGFEDGSAELLFEDDPDPDGQNAFGIGPGCVLPNPNDPEFPNTARPPVRMLEVGASLGALEFHSICQDDYSAAIAAIAQP